MLESLKRRLSEEENAAVKGYWGDTSSVSRDVVKKEREREKEKEKLRKEL